MNSHPGPKITGNGKNLRSIRFRNKTFEFDRNGKIIDPNLREIIQPRAKRTFYPRKHLQQNINTNTSTDTNSQNESDDNIFQISSHDNMTLYHDDSHDEFEYFTLSNLSDDPFPENQFIEDFSGMYTQFEQIQIIL